MNAICTTLMLAVAPDIQPPPEQLPIPAYTSSPLSILAMFPSLPFAADCKADNVDFQRTVKARWWAAGPDVDHWSRVVARTDFLYQCWDWLHAAHGGEGQGETYHLYSLNRLRALLGDDAFFAGRMPHPIPVEMLPGD